MKAVIFDFDGVIVDSERYWRREEKSLFSSIVPNWNYEDNAKIVGMTIPGTYNFIRRNYEINISLEEFLEVYKDLSRRVYDQCAIIDGVTDLLKQLEEGGIQIAVASSAPGKWVHKILKDLNIIDSFQVVVTADDIGIDEGKPKPTIYLVAADKLGIEPNKCIAIEDAANGVESAKNAGMYCIGVDFPDTTTQDLSRADQIIKSFDKITIPADS